MAKCSSGMRKWILLSAAAVGWVALAVYAHTETEKPASGGDLVPLDIKLPQPSLVGTPLDYWSERLEVTFKRRPPFLAPPGVTNVAKGKPVTASAKPILGKLEMITDGDKEATEEGLVELPEGTQYVQIDLKEPHEIFAVVVWHFHAGERVYFDVICRTATDPDFTENVVTLYNNDHDNSSKLGIGEDKEYIDTYEGRLIDGKGTTARYVRLYSNGNTTDDKNHYLEVEVYGRPL